VSGSRFCGLCYQPLINEDDDDDHIAIFLHSGIVAVVDWKCSVQNESVWYMYVSKYWICHILL